MRLRCFGVVFKDHLALAILFDGDAKLFRSSGAFHQRRDRRGIAYERDGIGCGRDRNRFTRHPDHCSGGGGQDDKNEEKTFKHERNLERKTSGEKHTAALDAELASENDGDRLGVDAMFFF